MSSRTESVTKLTLFSGLLGLLVTLRGIVDRRDIIALGGIILITCHISAIVRLAK